MTSAALVIPPQASIDGSIAAPGDLVVEGEVSGTITVGGEIAVAEGARCRASVRAADARIDGAVIGDLVCLGAAVVGPAGSIHGDVRAADVRVARRDQIVGHIADAARGGEGRAGEPAAAAPARAAGRRRVRVAPRGAVPAPPRAPSREGGSVERAHAPAPNGSDGAPAAAPAARGPERASADSPLTATARRIPAPPKPPTRARISPRAGRERAPGRSES